MTITSCQNIGEAKTILNDWAGGITGYIADNTTIKIQKSINSGAIYAEQSCSGGISAGIMSGELYVEDCYNIGNINAGVGCVGGIVGNIDNTGEATSYLKIENCYNRGNIGNVNNHGGILGIVNNKTTLSYELKNNYWLSNCGAEYGIGNLNNDKDAIKKDATDLQKLADTLGDAFTNDIQDENKKWKYNEGYPILEWQLN